MPCQVMGVVNLTPDSFSDGGQYLDPTAALAQIEQIFAAGADLVDVGAESSRPGADSVSADLEWKRLEPVLMALHQKNLLPKVSVDTRHDQTIQRLCELPVGYINNISGLASAETLAQIAARTDLNYICMHMQGRPKSMQDQPLEGRAAITAVDHFFAHAKTKLTAAGIGVDRQIFDPGIGFGKDDAANFQLLAATPRLAKEYRLLLGISRKSFLGRLLDLKEPTQRDPASKMLEFGLMQMGASIIRTHAVGPLLQMRSYLQ